MRRLTLLRHAKSSWDSPGLSDFERPLNDRGQRDAPAMGKRLKQSGIRPSLIVSSNALRAITTAQTVAAELGISANGIHQQQELYLAAPATIIDLLAQNYQACTNIMIVGHNPGLTELANRISDARIDNMPTCGIFSVEAAIEDWSELTNQTGRLAWFDYPKKPQS